MRRFMDESPGADSVVPINKYKVEIELSIEADSADEAWEYAKEFIAEAVQELESMGENKIFDYDILDAEPSELSLDF